MTGYVTIDPFVGMYGRARAGQRQEGSLQRMWHPILQMQTGEGKAHPDPVGELRPLTTQWWGTPDPASPHNFYPGVDLSPPGVLVVAPISGKVIELGPGPGGLQVTIEKLYPNQFKYRHRISRMAKVKPGIQAGMSLPVQAPIGVSANVPGASANVTWECWIAYPTQEQEQMHHRFERLLQRHPGNVSIQVMWAYYLTTADADVLNWLGGIERGGGIKPTQQALLKMGEWGETVSRQIVNFIQEGVQEGARFVGDVAGSAASGLAISSGVGGTLLALGAGVTLIVGAAYLLRR